MTQYFTAAIRQIEKMVADYGRDKVVDYINNRMSPANVTALAQALDCTTNGTSIVNKIEYSKSLIGKFVTINGYTLEILDYAPQTNIVVVCPTPMFTPEQQEGRDHVRQGFKLDGIEATLVETPITPHKHRQTTIDRAIAKNVKITDAQVAQSNTLAEVALDFVQSYKGSNTFVQDIAVKLADRGNLSIPQLRGALNVMIAEAKASRRDHSTVTTAQADKPLVLDFSSNRKQPPQATPEALQPTEHATPVVSYDDSVTSPHKFHKVPNGIYTVVLNDAGDYRTLRLVDCPDSFNKPAGTQIAQYLSGSDNENNYTGFAFVSGDQFNLWSKFKNPLQTKVQGLSFALTNLLTSTDQGVAFGQAYALKSGNCFICNRRLTTPLSIKSGIGPICADKLGIDQESLVKSERPSYEQALADVNELFND